MAVFTPVERDELDRWLTHYDLGSVSDFRGIPSGIENSNFFVTTEQHGTRHEYVLTLFERLTTEQLPFYLELMHHLSERGIPCPAPVRNRAGTLLGYLNGKPATLVTRLPGKWVEQPDRQHCALVGAALARMHQAARDFPIHQPNLRGLDWWRSTAPEILPYLPADTAALLTGELDHQIKALEKMGETLPSGPIHADLFRDNTLFEQEGEGARRQLRLGGFIDFYFAGWDRWLFDIAVCVNDWCVNRAAQDRTSPAYGTLDPGLTAAFLEAYAGERPFTPAEHAAWDTMLRAAALRFWISRLFDFHLPRPAEILTPHDPVHFELILRRRREQTHALPASLPI